MTKDEAETLVTWMAGTTSTRLLPGEVTIWIEQLMPLDVTLATKAIDAGREHWGRFPPWRDFKAAYRSQRELAKATAEQEAPVEKAKAVPEWVYVWWWAWNDRRPRSVVPVPQQQSPDSMSMENYEKLREEWVAAGSPRMKAIIPTAKTI